MTIVFIVLVALGMNSLSKKETDPIGKVEIDSLIWIDWQIINPPDFDEQTEKSDESQQTYEQFGDIGPSVIGKKW